MAIKKLLLLFIFVIGYGPILHSQSLPPILERAALENQKLIHFSISKRTIRPAGVSAKNMDFENNRLLHFNDGMRNKMPGPTLEATGDDLLLLSFAIDSTLYFGNLTDPYDSLVISRAALVDAGIPIYTKQETSAILTTEDTQSIIILLLAIISLTLAFLYWGKIRPQPMVAAVTLSDLETANVAKPEDRPEKSLIFRSPRMLDLLEERERSLLAFVFEHSADGRLSTIEEINKVIGAAKRSNDIQKRMRSDLIGSINQKLNIITMDKKPVIDKQRSAFDRRSFEYFIQPIHMELVEKVLGKK